MPNTVYNRLSVVGTAEFVDRFVEKVRSEDLDHDGEPYVLDFERHVPIPPGVEHGDRTWLDANWGSKQPMWSEVDEIYSGVAIFTFTTAWTAPHEWLERTAVAEPYLCFVHEFVEEFEQFWGRKRWERGVFVGSDDIEPTDLAWAYEDEDDEDDEEDEETIEREAADAAVDLLATVADRILATRGSRLVRSTGLDRLAEIAAPLGDAARVSHLTGAAQRSYGVEPADARFAIGDGRLVDAFCTHLVVAGGHALLTAAAYRMKAEQDIGFHTALHRVFDETAEGAYDGAPKALTGPSPADWLAQVLDYLGDSVNMLHAEALWEEGEVLPDWVRRWGASGAEAASNAFLVLASNCLCAIASLCPEGIDASSIDLIGPDEELRAVQDPRGPASNGRYRTSKRSIG